MAAVAVIVIVVILVVVYAAYSIASHRTVPSTTTIVARSTSVSTTTMIPMLNQAPAIRNFSLTSRTPIASGELPSQPVGVVSGAIDSYSNASRGLSMVIRVVEFSNLSTMMTQYDNITDYGPASSTLTYLQDLPVNSSGVGVSPLYTSPTPLSLYSITSHHGLALITVTLNYPTNTVNDAAGVQVLINALNASARLLK